MRSAAKLSLALVLAIGFAAGCSDKIAEDPIMRLSAEEAMEEGRRLMEKKKYSQAAEYFSHAFEVAPNSATGREALLLSADSLFKAGGQANYIKAEAKYRDFQNRFPTSDRADYVQLQIANCLGEQILKPDRDQSATFKAMEAYNQLLVLFPTTSHVDLARQKISEIRQNLAEHEFLVGKYNYRRRLFPAAVSRLGDLLEDYPEYERSDHALYFLGMAHFKMKEGEEAAEAFSRLREEYSDSKFVKKIPREKTKE